MSGTELEVREAKPVAVGPLTDGEFDNLFRVARALAASRMFRDSVQAEQAFARILCGRDLGLSPTESMTAIHIVEGKPELSADLQASMLRTYRGPDGERYDFRVTTPADKRDEECHVLIRRREPGEGWEDIGTEIFTWKDAQVAGLAGKQNWKKYPRNMMFARAISNAIAFFAPEAAHAPRMVVPPAEITAAIETSPGATAGTPAAGGPDDNVSNGERLPSSSGAAPGEDTVEGTAVEDAPSPAAPAPSDEYVRPCSQPQARLLARVLGEMEDAGREARFFEVLDVVGAPEHEEVAQRVVGMSYDQAANAIQELGQYVAPARSRTHA